MVKAGKRARKAGGPAHHASRTTFHLSVRPGDRTYASRFTPLVQGAWILPAVRAVANRAYDCPAGRPDLLRHSGLFVRLQTAPTIVRPGDRTYASRFTPLAQGAWILPAVRAVANRAYDCPTGRPDLRLTFHATRPGGMDPPGCSCGCKPRLRLSGRETGLFVRLQTAPMTLRVPGRTDALFDGSGWIFGACNIPGFIVKFLLCQVSLLDLSVRSLYRIPFPPAVTHRHILTPPSVPFVCSAVRATGLDDRPEPPVWPRV